MDVSVDVFVGLVHGSLVPQRGFLSTSPSPGEKDFTTMTGSAVNTKVQPDLFISLSRPFHKTRRRYRVVLPEGIFSDDGNIRVL